MSAEAVLAVGASPSPAPSGSPASLGAGGSGGSSAGGTGAGFGGGPGAGISKGPAGGAAEHSAPSPSGKHGESADSGEIHKSVGKGTRARAAQSSTPGQGEMQAGKNFSQTLAQSLASPAHTPAPAPAAAAPVTARAGKPAKASAAHSTDKARKPDPVSSAMAMVRQAVPVAAATTIVHAGDNKRHGAAQTVQAMRAESPRAAVSKDEQPALHAAMAAQAAGQGADAPQSESAQPVKPGLSSVSALNNAAMLAAGHLAAGPHAGAPADPASATLSQPLGSSGWNRQLGAQLTWMARQGIQSASLQIAPQHLGPVQVRISVHHGEASVWFGAAQAQTRQALTQALPELHAMFASQGLALTDSGVSHDAPRDPRRTVRQGTGAIGEVGATESGASGSSGVPAGIGLIDTYA